MLVLSRRAGEKIRIGKDIWVWVIATRGKQVRIGIEAPEAIEVTRPELSSERLIRAAPRNPLLCQ